MNLHISCFFENNLNIAYACVFLQNDDQTDEFLSQINVDNLSIEVSKINLI